MRLHRVFLFVFIGNAIAAAIVERTKETDCSLSPSLCSTQKTSSTSSSTTSSTKSSSTTSSTKSSSTTSSTKSSSTTSSTTSSSTTSSTTSSSASSSSTIDKTGTLTADFSASATAATATCGAGYLPETATNQAHSVLQANTTSTCATISPGWPCFGTGMRGSQDTISDIAGAFNPIEYHGTVAFLCNLSEVPMTTSGFDIAVLNDLIYVKHCANYTPAALMSPGEWVYGYLDWNTVQTVGQSSELCTHVMSQVVAYPDPMS
ncbi:hypothetical protein BPOR_1107g00020 [Botrytis porri]|uniref:Uncharacterized protein n=1 Tax=Botrytis porri TaxID=87229 RepID=A0A4Z1KK29_9HELO|nr:hypothetical protein BPOR_1107g00020 [Botrytis porri]